MKLFRYSALYLLITVAVPKQTANDFCGISNKAFSANEKIKYTVYYSVAGLYAAAGEAEFSSRLERMNNRIVYHVIGDGKTFSFYDNFFKVRDKYESFIDTATMQPLRFVRNVYEGGYKKFENVTFNKVTNTAVTNEGVYRVPTCVQDVLSAIYYSRNIDFGKYKVNDKIPFTLFLDKEIFNMYVRYLGRETIKTRYGKFNAIKFKPLLIKGTIFEGGEKMTVWVTDDGNRIPVRIESPISVGSIKVDMMGYSNLRHPVTSLISLR